MRQNTCLMARGMFFSGFSDSPAATPISSVPWNEKPAIIATPTMAGSPPANGASAMKKLLSPGDVWPLITPKIMARPTPIKTMTVMTLIIANQYSASPKPFTEMKFSRNISARKITLQYIPGT